MISTRWNFVRGFVPEVIILCSTRPVGVVSAGDFGDLGILLRLCAAEGLS